MRVVINTPSAGNVRTGNRSSAEQWRSLIASLGHEVRVVSSYAGEKTDWLIGMHAVKSADAVAACAEKSPQSKIAVVLTGTDIYPEPSAIALETMRRADVLVGLQPTAGEQVPEEFRAKLRVIVQASSPVEQPAVKSLDPFDVCVVGHLRDVKDPMLTAEAARLLPKSSKVRVLHAGAILDSKYAARVEAEQHDNQRYQWLGELGTGEVRALIANCQLLVLTSRSEGAGRVIGSAIAKRTPVLTSAIHGVVGLVGEEYPGLFPVGDASALADLLDRAETDATYRSQLAGACREKEYLFEPERELAGWRELLEGTPDQ